MTRFFSLLFALLSVTPLAAQESVTVRTDVDYRAVALRIIEDFAEPRYGAFWTRTQAQRAAWDAFCAADPSEEDFGRLTAQFVETVNAWAAIEILRYGLFPKTFAMSASPIGPSARTMSPAVCRSFCPKTTY